MGKDQQYNVYEGELTAIILGLHLIGKVTDDHQSITININNQATIKTMDKPQQHSAQYLVNTIRQSIIIYKAMKSHAQHTSSQRTRQSQPSSSTR